MPASKVQRAEVAERRAKAVALRAAGATWAEVAAACGHKTPAAAAQDVSRGLRGSKERDYEPCGTRAAYQRHLLNGEEACTACAEANREQARTLACSICSAPMSRGGRRKPGAVLICRDCRRAAGQANGEIPCPVCGQLFDPHLKRSCSISCGQRLAAAERNGTDPAAYMASRTLRQHEKNARRRQGITKDPVPYTRAEIAERDGYRCGLCGEPVDTTLSGMNRLGPTIDHIVPLSLSHDDRRTNVQLAHRFCNLRKHNRIK
jgi:5-methylcytosine-specific restriction endonuclease McrA